MAWWVGMGGVVLDALLVCDASGGYLGGFVEGIDWLEVSGWLGILCCWIGMFVPVHGLERFFRVLEMLGLSGYACVLALCISASESFVFCTRYRWHDCHNPNSQHHAMLCLVYMVCSCNIPEPWALYGVLTIICTATFLNSPSHFC